ADNKSNLIVIDHSGAVHRHGLLEDEITWTLDVDGKAENETHEKRTERSLDAFVDCSQCGSVRERGEACPNCGFKPGPRPDLVIATDEDLVEVGAKPAPYDPQERIRWHAMLVFIGRDRGYKDGWAGHKYKEKFGNWPPRTIPFPQKPSPEVLSWVRSRQIAYAKAQQKASGAA